MSIVRPSTSELFCFARETFVSVSGLKNMVTLIALGAIGFGVDYAIRSRKYLNLKNLARLDWQLNNSVRDLLQTNSEIKLPVFSIKNGDLLLNNEGNTIPSIGLDEGKEGFKVEYDANRRAVSVSAAFFKVIYAFVDGPLFYRSGSTYTPLQKVDSRSFRSGLVIYPEPEQLIAMMALMQIILNNKENGPNQKNLTIQMGKTFSFNEGTLTLKRSDYVSFRKKILSCSPPKEQNVDEDEETEKLEITQGMVDEIKSHLTLLEGVDVILSRHYQTTKTQYVKHGSVLVVGLTILTLAAGILFRKKEVVRCAKHALKVESATGLGILISRWYLKPPSRVNYSGTFL